MSTLRIYDSQGERLGEGPASESDQIEDFFFDGVRLYLETETEPTLTMFFRARDSEASRAEQYYAVYETDTSTGLFERFERDLRAEIEDHRDMIIETASDDAQLVSLLTDDLTVPGTADQHGALSSLLAERTPLRVRVPTPAAALALLQRYAGSPAERFAIGDDTTTESVTGCDLAVEPGGGDGLEPLGDSVDAFDERLRQTTANAARPRATSGRTTTDEPEHDRLEDAAKEGFAVFIGVIVAGLLLVALLNGAAVIGLEIPGTDWLIVV